MTMHRLPRRDVVHLADIHVRPPVFSVWERYRHRQAHWFVECVAESVSGQIISSDHKHSQLSPTWQMGVFFYVYAGELGSPQCVSGLATDLISQALDLRLDSSSVTSVANPSHVGSLAP